MANKNRLDGIIDRMIRAEEPVSGDTLAAEFNVSRQIIVKDIGKLRESGMDIRSTKRGYLLVRPQEFVKVLKVRHTVDEMEEELNLFVDLGAEVRDVFIYHKMYGEIRAKLGIRCRKDVQDFLRGLESGASAPLMTATNGFHYHTVVTRDAETMQLVEDALWKRKFLAELREYEPEPIRDQLKQEKEE